MFWPKSLNPSTKTCVQDKTSPILNGSKKLFTKKKENEKNIDLDIYQYPIIEFTDEQKEKAITILLVGETGSGKTTLIKIMLGILGTIPIYISKKIK